MKCSESNKPIVYMQTNSAYINPKQKFQFNNKED